MKKEKIGVLLLSLPVGDRESKERREMTCM